MAELATPEGLEPTFGSREAKVLKERVGISPVVGGCLLPIESLGGRHYLIYSVGSGSATLISSGQWEED